MLADISSSRCIIVCRKCCRYGHLWFYWDLQDQCRFTVTRRIMIAKFGLQLCMTKSDSNKIIIIIMFFIITMCIGLRHWHPLIVCVTVYATVIISSSPKAYTHAVVCEILSTCIACAVKDIPYTHQAFRSMSFKTSHGAETSVSIWKLVQPKY